MDLNWNFAMHDASTPITFQRHCHQLRAVMIDNRPWFVAIDFALMIAAARPYRLTKRLYPTSTVSRCCVLPLAVVRSWS